jgi:hypothetical protein
MEDHMMSTTTTTGPTVERECGYCSGTGLRTDTSVESEPTVECSLCHGTGAITVDVHPFVALGRCTEHIMAIRVSMGLQRTETFTPAIGTPAYHVDAAEDALQSLFQQLVVMLPDEWDRTERGEA